MRSRVRSTRKKQEVFKWTKCMEDFVHGQLEGRSDQDGCDDEEQARQERPPAVARCAATFLHSPRQQVNEAPCETVAQGIHEVIADGIQTTSRIDNRVDQEHEGREGSFRCRTGLAA